MAQSRSQSDLQFECVLIGNQRQTMHDVNAQLVQHATYLS